MKRKRPAQHRSRELTIEGAEKMKSSASYLAIVAWFLAAGLLQANRAAAGVNVNESGNAVLCKGSTCTWLKQACNKESGTYTEGAGGTGKCNFQSTGKLTFVAKTEVGKQASIKRLRSIPPNKGKLVRSTGKLKAKGAGGTEVVCCTHWNTSTGGTGCTTYPDSCPDNTFTVECGKDGCW